MTPVYDASGINVVGVTFTTPMHWAEWDSRQDQLIEAVAGKILEIKAIWRIRLIEAVAGKILEIKAMEQAMAEASRTASDAASDVEEQSLELDEIIQTMEPGDTVSRLKLVAVKLDSISGHLEFLASDLDP